MNKDTRPRTVKFERYEGAEIETLQATYKFSVVFDIELANKQNGNCWFDKASKKFFKSRYSQDVLFGRFFISTEQDGTNPRLATIRMSRDNGAIQTVGEFQGYRTKTSAKTALATMIYSGVVLRGY